MSRLERGRFIGRRTDLERVIALLEESRVVTLWAAAGMGKTSLARELVASRAHTRAQRQRDEPACFVDLSTVHDRAGVCARVAEGLGMGPSARNVEDAIEDIGHALATRRRTLLVLDNFEQLVEEASATVGAWTGMAPEARILVTSRERLRLRAEASYELPPLSLPEGDGGAFHSDAVELFVDRARALAPDYALGPDNALDVARLVRKLEGIPLVIELAAARVGVLGVEGLLARLPRSLDLLARGTRDMGPRQATLRGAIAWSWDLLSETEGLALAQASTFQGGFTLEAAESVLSFAGESAPSVLDVVQSLRDKSLLTGAREGSSGRVRFGMYESIRAFAEEKLALVPAQARDVHARHAAYYLALAGAHASPPTMSCLLAEHDNLMAIVTRALAAVPLAPSPSQALTVATRALSALIVIDPVREARESCATRIGALTAALDAADVAARARGESAGGPNVAPELLAQALEARGSAYRTAGDHVAAERDLERGLALAKGAGDRSLEGTLLGDLGVLHHERRAMDRARMLYEASLAIHRERGDARAMGRALANLGALDHDRKEWDGARRRYEEALDIFVRIGDARLEGIHSTNLGVLEQEQGNTVEAEGRYRHGLALLERSHERRFLAITLGNLGSLHHAQGRLDEAARAFERALVTLRDLGDRRSEALCVARLAAVQAALGHVAEAETALDDAERLATRLGDRVTVAAVDVSRGFCDVAAGHAAKARERIAGATSLGGAATGTLSDDVRSMVRLLEEALARLDRGEAPEANLDDDALALGPEGTWFRPPRGAWHDLRERQAARLLLWALAQDHLAGGRGLTPEALWHAGWPGAHIAPAAQTNRLNVTLAYLRKCGLGGHLVRHDGAYALDSALRIQRMVTLPAALRGGKVKQ